MRRCSPRGVRCRDVHRDLPAEHDALAQPEHVTTPEAAGGVPGTTPAASGVVTCSGCARASCSAGRSRWTSRQRTPRGLHRRMPGRETVSYTHLTLPTILR